MGAHRNSHLPREGCPGLRCARRYEGGDWIPPPGDRYVEARNHRTQRGGSPRWRRRKPSRQYAPDLAVRGRSYSPWPDPTNSCRSARPVTGSDDCGWRVTSHGYLAVLGGLVMGRDVPRTQIKLDQIFTPEGLRVLPRRSNSALEKCGWRFPGKLSDYIRTDLPQSMVTVSLQTCPVNGVSENVRCSSSKVTRHRHSFHSDARPYSRTCARKVGRSNTSSTTTTSHRSLRWTGGGSYL